MSGHLGLPNLPELVSRFLYEQTHPDLDIPLIDVPLGDCPDYTGKVYVYPSAIATFYAPSDRSGIGGMYRERIRSVQSWRGGAERRDCVYVEHNAELPGFRGLHAARIRLFLKIKHHSVRYPCALVTWFSAIGDHPCDDTQMWMVEPDFDENGGHIMSIIHLDTILRSAHLVGIAGEHSIPRRLSHTDSLDAFKSFYVNKFIDYHAHEIAF